MGQGGEDVGCETRLNTAVPAAPLAVREFEDLPDAADQP